ENENSPQVHEEAARAGVLRLIHEHVTLADDTALIGPVPQHGRLSGRRRIGEKVAGFAAAELPEVLAVGRELKVAHPGPEMTVHLAHDIVLHGRGPADEGDVLLPLY